MKKWLISFIMLLSLVGCSSTSLSSEDELYLDVVEKLNSVDEYNEIEGYSLELTYQKMDEGYRYVLTLDNPSISMYSVILVSDAGESDDEILPSLGIYDGEEYNLVPDVVDKDNNYYKGISLSGSVKEKSDVVVYLSYCDANNDHRNEQIIKLEKE